MSNKLNYLHVDTEQREKSSSINFFILQIGQRMILSSLLHILLCFPNRCSIYLRWSSNGKPYGEFWLFFSESHNILGGSEVLNCWRPSVRTEWTCPRAVSAGRQVSTHRQDLQKLNKHTRAPFLLWKVKNSEQEQALRNQLTHPA